VVEAVYEGVSFDAFLQQQLNCYLVDQGKEFRVGKSKNGTGSFPQSFERLSASYSLITNDSRPVQLSHIFGLEQIKTAIKQIGQAYDWYWKLMPYVANSSRPDDTLSNSLFRLPKNALDKTLTQFCDAFIDRISGAIGKDQLLLLNDHSHKAHQAVSVSVGFHLTEKQGSRKFLKYYSTRGWKLNALIENQLIRLKKQYRSADDKTKLQFLFKCILVASIAHFQDLTKRRGGAKFALRTNVLPEDTRELLSENFITLINRYLPEDETKRWLRVRDRLKEHFGNDNCTFEDILRALLTLNEWNQMTTLGIYPKLLNIGEELYSNKFSMKVSPGDITRSNSLPAQPSSSKRLPDRLALWNYSVVTTIEEFFMKNSRLDLSMNGGVFETYLVARPLFFGGENLGDYFVTGTYLEGGEQTEIVSELLRRIRELLPFLEKEFEYLSRFIFGHSIFAKQVLSGWSDPRYELTLRQDYKKLWGGPIGKLMLNTYKPTRKLISDTILEHAIRAGLSGIMSRNTSHNIGSHVDFYMSDAENIRNPRNTGPLNVERIAHETANLFRYHRERLDFISEILTSDPCWAIPVRFYSDIIRPFKEQAALRRWILASENISDIDIRVTINGREAIDNQDTVRDDVTIGLVSGSVGAHAIYSILENIVRNSAKHSKTEQDKTTLTTTIEVDDNHGDLVKLTIYDDRSSYTSAIQKRITTLIQDRLIDERGRLVPGGWGIKEMRICAEYLKMISPSQAELRLLTKDFEPNELMTVGCVTRNRRDKRLAYQIFLPKPKDLLVVDASREIRGSHSLNRIGVFVTHDDFYLKTNRVMHNMLLINPRDEEDVVKEPITEHYAEYPIRTLVVENTKVPRNNGSTVCPFDQAKYLELGRELNSIRPPEQLIIETYRSWVAYLAFRARKLAPSERLELWLGFDKIEKNAEPISRWRSIASKFNNSFAPFNWSIRVFVKGDEITTDGEFPTISEESRVIIFEHHGQIFKKLAENESTAELPRRVYSYSEFKADSPLGTFLYNPPEPTNHLAASKMALGLIEAGLSTICVVDERLFKSCDDWKLFGQLTRANIIFPKIRYDKPNGSDMAKVLEATRAFGFLVIHQGILDKAFDSDQERIEAWIANDVSHLTPFVVVISGRGVPHNLPTNSRSLPLSAIDKWLLGSQSKFHLVQTLLGSRSRRLDAKNNYSAYV
jgi:hypothetical protein